MQLAGLISFANTNLITNLFSERFIALIDYWLLDQEMY